VGGGGNGVIQVGVGPQLRVKRAIFYALCTRTLQEKNGWPVKRGVINLRRIKS